MGESWLSAALAASRRRGRALMIHIVIRVVSYCNSFVREGCDKMFQKKNEHERYFFSYFFNGKKRPEVEELGA